MNKTEKTLPRRQALQGLLALGGLMTASRLQAATPSCAAQLTPKQTAGPFYPIRPQADTDSDLTVIPGSMALPEGQIIFVEGVVTNQDCKVVEGVLVEIWQACASGKYNHPNDPNTAAIDPNFQYWGKATTNKDGFYRFKTIIPGAYPAAPGWVRPPHIHFKLSKLGMKELITQMYFASEATLNDTDHILQDLPKVEQSKVIVEVKDVGAAHPTGKFDISVKTFV